MLLFPPKGAAQGECEDVSLGVAMLVRLALAIGAFVFTLVKPSRTPFPAAVKVFRGGVSGHPLPMRTTV